MKIHDNLNNFDAHNPVVTIGTFDGIHKGHQLVVEELKHLAKQLGGETVIFTFFPHPRIVTAPNEKNLRLITTKEEKIRRFSELGIDHLIIHPFDKAFSKMDYTDFVKDILVKQMNTKCLVVGYDHRFGKNREGGYEYLKECADKLNFQVERTEALSLEADKVSSTKIRSALEFGNIKKANTYLGYNFTLHGTVVDGKKLGRKLGFPTANIESSDKHKLIPGYGVYAVYVEIEEKRYKGMLNIGMRPTFNNNADNRSIEVNIFDFDQDIYSKNITLIFEDKIREEQKFEGIDSLIIQLNLDKKNALEILK